MTGLTWNGREQDRQLLAGLDRAAFKTVAAELQVGDHGRGDRHGGAAHALRVRRVDATVSPAI